MKENVDGVPWEEFREICDTDPGSQTYYAWSMNPKYVNFRHEGFRITLNADGTWSADSAPDWDGSS